MLSTKFDTHRRAIYPSLIFLNVIICHCAPLPFFGHIYIIYISSNNICSKNLRISWIIVISDRDSQLKLKSRRFHWKQLLFPKWYSTGTKILFNSVDNSPKTHRIRLKQVSFDSNRLTLQVHTKKMHLSLKTQVLHREIPFFRVFLS